MLTLYITLSIHNQTKGAVMRLSYLIIFFLLVFLVLRIKKAYKNYTKPDFGLSPEEKQMLKKQLERPVQYAKVISLEEFKKNMNNN